MRKLFLVLIFLPLVHAATIKDKAWFAGLNTGIELAHLKYEMKDLNNYTFDTTILNATLQGGFQAYNTRFYASYNFSDYKGDDFSNYAHFLGVHIDYIPVVYTLKDIAFRGLIGVQAGLAITHLYGMNTPIKDNLNNLGLSRYTQIQPYIKYKFGVIAELFEHFSVQTALGINAFSPTEMDHSSNPVAVQFRAVEFSLGAHYLF